MLQKSPRGARGTCGRGGYRDCIEGAGRVEGAEGERERRDAGTKEG